MLINAQGDVRCHAPKLSTREEVVRVSQALINQGVAIANMYGVQISIKDTQKK